MDERERLIIEHRPLVEQLARRYQRRGEPLDDLVQAGMVGLINAVDRYDPERGVDLAAFAVPTVLGEIRRHFRDRTWAVRPPRGVQEMRMRVGDAIESLSSRSGRSPSVAEIATELGAGIDDVLDALASQSARAPDSLSADPGDPDERPTDIGVEDPGYARADARVTMGAALEHLGDRERRIVALRFERGMTQSEIGRELGISQMHVSRLLRRALQALRDSRTTTGSGPGPEPGARAPEDPHDLP